MKERKPEKDDDGKSWDKGSRETDKLLDQKRNEKRESISV
jgi:hypothetical protein